MIDGKREYAENVYAAWQFEQQRQRSRERARNAAYIVLGTVLPVVATIAAALIIEWWTK